MRRWSAALLFAVLVLALAANAKATPSFPDVVQSHYGLSMHAVDPPLGCKLCHIDDIGGTPATLRPFGRLLYTQFGVMPYDDPSLQSALTQLDSQDPVLAAEIKNGTDPNATAASGGGSGADGGLGGAGAMGPTDPIPYYGCTVRPRQSTGGQLWPVGVVAAAVALARLKSQYERRRRRRSSAPWGK